MMIDTQILSNAYKGHMNLPVGARISSVVAHEFLQVYDPNSTTNFAYYIKYMAQRHVGAAAPSPSNRKGGALERLVLDFGSDYPQLIEFNSRATAAIINDKNQQAFAHILAFLDKPLQKKLRSRFAFLCKHVDECVALAPQTADLGLQLLWEFVQHNNVKANFRNSVNDMLILSTAIVGKERLVTEDNVLSRFAVSQCHAVMRPAGIGIVEIDFTLPKEGEKHNSVESKGYINRGWRIATELRSRAGYR